MIKAILFDFSRVLVFPNDSTYGGSLNELHAKHEQNPQYIVFGFFRVNTELLKYLESIQKTVDLYIFTSDSIQNAAEFQQFLHPLFRKIYSASTLGVRKTDPVAYRRILDDLGLSPDQVLFVDDTESNVAAAKEEGLSAVRYVSNEDLFSKLMEFGLGSSNS